MPGCDISILVIGGGSRIAAALESLLGDCARYVSRRPIQRPRHVLVDNYFDIPAHLFDGIGCVINCVGISTGSTSLMHRINVDLPLRLAATAKAAGVEHLIHVSSFSVYGGARAIDRHTLAMPSSDYGHSKLAADTGLLALADDRFAVTVLRLPLIYGQNISGKLGQIVQLWQRLRIMPVPTDDVVRAMIGVDLSAEVIAHLARAPHGGVVFAADPLPFTYALTAQARGGGLYRLRLPRAVTRLAERAAPAIGGRLFADSSLSDHDNIAVRYNLATRIYRDISAATFD